MTDITKCPGLLCPKKETCYRYLAPSRDYQTYFTETPLKEDGIECDEYWHVAAKAPKEEMDNWQ